MKFKRKVRNRFFAEIQELSSVEYEIGAEASCTCGAYVKQVFPQIKKDIIIVYAKGTRDLASIQMRLPQVARNLLYYNSKIKIIALSLSSPELFLKKDKIILLTKFASELISLSDLKTLANNQNFVIVDPIDNLLKIDKFKNVNLILASSLNQEQFLNDLGIGSVKLLYHSSDLRLDGIKSQQDNFSIGYFGNLKRIPIEFGSITDLSIVKTPLSYEPRRNIPRYADAMKEFPVHLAAGSIVPNLVFKPFTKGIVAEHVGAISLISRIEKEAVTFLGSNYPYIADDNSKKSIIEMIDFMRETFKSATWDLAKESHKKLRPLTCRYHVTMLWQSLLCNI